GATAGPAALTNLGAVAKAGDTMTGSLVIAGATPGQYPLDVIGPPATPRSFLRLINTTTGTGFSFDPNWPTVNFNSYHNGTQKVAIGAGYAGAIFLNPVNGDI